MKPRLLFDLPVLRPATTRSFDTGAAALDRWLAQLPVASLGETCRQVFLAVYEVNRTQVPLAQRLEFLERLAQPLALVMPALQRHYIGQPFPLGEKAQRVARLAVDLQVELVIGYRLVLEGVRRQSWLLHWGRAQRKALAAHRMLHYLGGILSDYQWLHLPYPRGVWRTVHRIFRHEGRAGRVRRVLTRLEGTDTTTTVMDEYKRLLLRSLVPPARITVEQWQCLGNAMDDWLGLIDLDPTSVEYGFWVRLDSDSPPTELPVDFAAAMGKRGKYTVLNTRRLVRHMEQLLAVDGEPLPPGLSRDSVETLRNVWSGARGRHAERRQGHGQEMKLLVGVSTLYHTLVDSSPQPVPQVLELEHHGGKTSLGPLGQAWISTTAVESLPQPVGARIIDHSESGYGLELPADTGQPLKEGDIIGLRRGAALRWEIGYVCWLRAVAGEPLGLGVQHLAVEAMPVEVTVSLEDGHSAPLGCLLGSTGTGETALFMPNLPGIEHKALQLGYCGHETPITLLERLDGSTGFSAFLFDTPLQQEPGAGLAAQEAWHLRAEAPAAAATEAERYLDVWSAL
jgi:hypothetical protein